ncbi:hypothetical protein GCM10022252_29860 [Streptosporangium oxazolinicum]|uniref:Uncharacterized protein n=1 Tax=Streptosporangium oxazolinicum TaxID=909287 RepID=A0ABP8AUJ8_9ACTN
MPVLATRLAGLSVTTFAAPSAPSAPLAALHEPVTSHLAEEFLTVPLDTVDRCVAEVRARAEHLGIEPTAEIVERVAREHLLALVNSAPPPRGPR